MKKIAVAGMAIFLMLVSIMGMGCGSDGDRDQDENNIDTTTPVIWGITVSNLTETTATISWKTDELSTSNIEVGLTTGYDSSFPSQSDTTAYVTSHSLEISGLSSNTTYHYRVKSEDASVNEAISDDHIFTTSDLVADFIANPTQIFEGNSVQFNAECSRGVPPYTYEWDFNNDGIVDSTKVNPSYIYDFPNKYSVSLKVTDATSGQQEITKWFYVSVLPYLDVSDEIILKFAPTLVFCQGEQYYPCSFFFDGDVDITGFDNSNAYQTGQEPFVYVHVVSNGTAVTIQYWFYYAFNEHPGWPDHQHDWECVYVVFDHGDFEQPREIGYSQHQGVNYYDWDDVQVRKNGTHVTAYVALGSHAFYPNEDRASCQIESFNCEDEWEWTQGSKIDSSSLNYTLVWGNDESVWGNPQFDDAENFSGTTYQRVYYDDLGSEQHPSPDSQKNLLYDTRTMWPDEFPGSGDSPWLRNNWNETTPGRIIGWILSLI